MIPFHSCCLHGLHLKVMRLSVYCYSPVCHHFVCSCDPPTLLQPPAHLVHLHFHLLHRSPVAFQCLCTFFPAWMFLMLSLGSLCHHCQSLWMFQGHFCCRQGWNCHLVIPDWSYPWAGLWLVKRPEWQPVSGCPRWHQIYSEANHYRQIWIIGNGQYDWRSGMPSTWSGPAWVTEETDRQTIIINITALVRITATCDEFLIDHTYICSSFL